MTRVPNSERCGACHAYISTVMLFVGACTTSILASPKSAFETYGKYALEMKLRLIFALNSAVIV